MKLEEQIQKALDKGMHEIAAQAANYMVLLAATGYQSSTQYNKVDATVLLEPTADGFTVRAEGKDVVFLEFGAGVATDPDARAKLEKDPPFPITEGSYSNTHGGHYATNKYWYYGGKRWTEVTPTHAMWRAREETIKALPLMAKEVFK